MYTLRKIIFMNAKANANIWLLTATGATSYMPRYKSYYANMIILDIYA